MTKGFSFYKVLEKYESKSQEIFSYIINNPKIQHYEVIVGLFYCIGFGINKNENAAFSWYIKASQQNDINGYYEVGFYYEFYKQNYEEAFKFYQLAANNGLNIAS